MCESCAWHNVRHRGAIEWAPINPDKRTTEPAQSLQFHTYVPDPGGLLAEGEPICDICGGLKNISFHEVKS